MILRNQIPNNAEQEWVICDKYNTEYWEFNLTEWNSLTTIFQRNESYIESSNLIR